MAKEYMEHEPLVAGRVLELLELFCLELVDERILSSREPSD
jgi:hypothetical protein